MKFTGFKVIPCVRVWFPEDGVCYYEIADDQDPLLLARTERVDSLYYTFPDDLELRWAYRAGSVAIREASSNPDEETPVSGDFSGFGAVLEATYVNDEGVTEEVILSEGDSQYIEQLCTALNALLEPVRIVADISNGILYGTWSDRPARVLYKSDDPDEVTDFAGAPGATLLKDMGDGYVAHWTHDAELFSDIVDHYHNQLEE